MKLNLSNALIVVEGSTDKNYLSSFIDSSFYIVNGSAISKKDLQFLKLASKNKDIIILTDPDFPGMQIRNKINQNVEGCYNAFIKKEFAIKHNKVGVAECEKEEIIRALKNIQIFKKSEEKTLNLQDLFSLGLSGKEDSKKLRDYISDYFFIGYCNTKQMLFRLNCLKVSKNDLEEVIRHARY